MEIGHNDIASIYTFCLEWGEFPRVEQIYIPITYKLFYLKNTNDQRILPNITGKGTIKLC